MPVYGKDDQQVSTEDELVGERDLDLPVYGKEVDQVHQQQSSIGGATYIRWGRRDCPGGREALYSGQAASKHYTQAGGGNNYQCFPDHPEYSDFRAGCQYHSVAYGVEYEAPIVQLGGSTYLHDHNVPCALCYVPDRIASVMIPAKITCPHGWTKEYEGYLMSAHHAHHSHTYECIDRDAQAAPGGRANTNGGLFYHVEANCGTNLHCPPYDASKELTCVVCTK